MFILLCTFFASLIPIGFAFSYAFLDAVSKKYEKLQIECLDKHLSLNTNDFAAFIDWLVVYFGILKQKCELDASLFNVIIFMLF